jgi:Phage integrase, N-terminal SAM-like domain
MSTHAVTPLRHRMIEDMNARKLCAGTQRGHIHSCKRFAAFLNRSPDTATTEDIRRFQLHLAEAGVSICNRNRIMTGVRFLFRVTLRRLRGTVRSNPPDRRACPLRWRETDSNPRSPAKWRSYRHVSLMHRKAVR